MIIIWIEKFANADDEDLDDD